jgi:osmotically-inducible protein OsmY
MWEFQDRDDNDFTANALTFGLGAIGGLALGVLLSGRFRPQAATELGEDLSERVRDVARRVRPARLLRLDEEQAGINALEDEVLSAFLSDQLTNRHAIEIGAISRGIVELSGSVETEEDADYAVRLAGRVPGVHSVINRLEIEHKPRRASPRAGHDLQREGNRIGMGSRRQGRETDPDRPDDSQTIEGGALEEADRAQFADEGYGSRPLNAERPEVQQPVNRTNFSEDELDNQDPHGKHATVTLDSAPQQLNAEGQVGEGLKPGVELALEQADLPVKPE